MEVKNRAIAEIVTQYYPAEEDPKLIALFHTHPSGGTTPSPSDKDWGPKRKRDFDRQFDDYEFFFGIHALQDTCDPNPSWLRQPVQTAEHEVSWWDENRKHTLALYDADCEPRPVVVR